MAEFGLNILVGIVTAAELSDAINHVPDWWDGNPDSKHSVILSYRP